MVKLLQSRAKRKVHLLTHENRPALFANCEIGEHEHFGKGEAHTQDERGERHRHTTND